MGIFKMKGLTSTTARATMEGLTTTTTRANRILTRKNLDAFHHGFEARRNIGAMFQGWFTAAFNKVDDGRIQEVGIDRATAEWVLRCGGKVKCLNSKKFLTDYNSIGSAGNLRQNRIWEIDFTDACVKDEGFLHLKDLDRLTHVTLSNNKYLNNDSLGFLCSYTRDKLRWLKLQNNGTVTDKGVLFLKTLKQLEYLNLQNLPGVEDPRNVFSELSNALPSC